MCRSKTKGGRRCPKTEAVHERERQAAKRYYQRSKARKQIAELAAKGIPAMDDMDCPTTYHAGKKLDLLSPPRRPRVGANKPPGLWSSPGRESGGGVMTTWTDRSVIEYGEPMLDSSRLWALDPQPGAVVIRLDTAEDIRAFGQAFDFTEDTEKSRRATWEKVRALGIDGVMLTEQGVAATSTIRYGSQRDEDPRGWAAGDTLRNWDVGSVVWLRNDHLTASDAQFGAYPLHEVTPQEQRELDRGHRRSVPTHDLGHDDIWAGYDEGRPTTV